MNIQPGNGYGFSSSSKGASIDIQYPWSEWDQSIDIPTPPAPTLEPFTIVDKSDGSDYKFSAVAGMVNSIIPQIGSTAVLSQRLDQIPVPTTDFVFDVDTNYSYIYLRVSSSTSGTTVTFPVTGATNALSPRVLSFATEQTATADHVFFLLATAYKDGSTITITQLATGSQWCDRIQVGSTSAIPYYFFAKA